MKKYSIFILTFVLITALFAGCRRNVGRDTEPATDTMPSIIPTQPTEDRTTDPTNDTAGATDGTDGYNGDNNMDSMPNSRMISSQVY